MVSESYYKSIMSQLSNSNEKFHIYFNRPCVDEIIYNYCNSYPINYFAVKLLGEVIDELLELDIAEPILYCSEHKVTACWDSSVDISAYGSEFLVVFKGGEVLFDLNKVNKNVIINVIKNILQN